VCKAKGGKSSSVIQSHYNNIFSHAPVMELILKKTDVLLGDNQCHMKDIPHGVQCPMGDKVSLVARMLRDRNHYLDTVPR